jgi:hypothetical protein
MRRDHSTAETVDFDPDDISRTKELLPRVTSVLRSERGCETFLNHLMDEIGIDPQPANVRFGIFIEKFGASGGGNQSTPGTW